MRIEEGDVPGWRSPALKERGGHAQHHYGESVARVARRQWQAGKRPKLDQLKPLYLRPPAVDEKKP